LHELFRQDCKHTTGHAEDNPEPRPKRLAQRMQVARAGAGKLGRGVLGRARPARRVAKHVLLCHVVPCCTCCRIPSAHAKAARACMTPATALPAGRAIPEAMARAGLPGLIGLPRLEAMFEALVSAAWRTARRPRVVPGTPARSNPKTEAVKALGVSREASSCSSPLPSHSSSPMPYPARRRAAGFCGNTRALRLSKHVTT
jgi:hypothetical protein